MREDTVQIAALTSDHRSLRRLLPAVFGVVVGNSVVKNLVKMEGKWLQKFINLTHYLIKNTSIHSKLLILLLLHDSLAAEKETSVRNPSPEKPAQEGVASLALLV